MNKNANKKKQNKTFKEYMAGYWPYILFVLSALVLIYRARLSFCWSDESFYFSTSNRFLQGDKIFVHEWFPTQLVSLILLPFHFIFKLISGGNEGVILYFRILYVIFSLIITAVIYEILKKYYGGLAAVCAALFYQYYTHLNIATMSYYTLSYSFFLLSMLLIYDYIRKQAKEPDKTLVKQAVAAGMAFALSVLSLPSLVAFYALALAGFIAGIFVFKKHKALLLRLLTWLHVGIIIPAVLVLIYVLPRSGIAGIFDNLEYVLSDEEHVVASISGPFRNFFDSVYAVFDKRAVFIAVILSFVCFVYSIISKNKKENSIGPVKNILFILDLLLFVFFFLKSMGHTGFIATTVLLFSIPLFLLQDKKDWLLFLLLVVNGMIFSMTYSYSSMCDLYVLSIGHNIAAIAGICFVGSYARDIKTAGTFKAYIVLYIIMLLAVVQTMVLRFVNVYRDGPVLELNSLIREGPAAGLYTTKEHCESYMGVLGLIGENELAQGDIFFTKLLPWGYLATDMKCAAPTTWRTKLSSQRLGLYYELQPEKIPEVVIVLKDFVGSYNTCGDVQADPYPNENEMDGELLEILKGGNYTCEDSDYAVIYRYRQ